MFIGSADLMERNLDRRVEVLCPVHDPALHAYLRDAVLELVSRRTPSARGRSTRPASTVRRSGTASAGINAQQALLTRHTVEYQRE